MSIRKPHPSNVEVVARRDLARPLACERARREWLKYARDDEKKRSGDNSPFWRAVGEQYRAAQCVTTDAPRLKVK